MTDPINATLQQAVAHHQAGYLAEAEQAYRTILQTNPQHPDANHNLGVLLAQAGRHAEAIPCLNAALEADPAQGQYWLSYAEALLGAGHVVEAQMVMQTALQSGLDTPEAYELLRRTEKAGAVVIPQVVLPAGEIPAQTSQSQIEPEQLILLFNGGRYAEMEELARRMLEQRPDTGFGWKALGLSLQGQGKDALPALQRAAELLPHESEVFNNLGTAQQAVGRLEEAIESFRRALLLNPDYAEAHYNLGLGLQEAGQYYEAAASYRRALELKPDHVESLNNLGNVIKELEGPGSALEYYHRALELKPDYDIAHTNLIFALDLLPGISMAELFRERQKWDEIHGAPLWTEPHHDNSSEPNRRLRIGYVSADFRNHSAARVFGAMLTCYDRNQFEVYAYSNGNKSKEDNWSELFQRNVTAWRDVSHMPDEALAKLIRHDGIDILVDLSGHMAGNRLLVFARKPAPVQVTAWGYATGTGLRAMDAFFTDPIMVPPQEKQYFREEVRYLPCAAGLFSPDPYPEVSDLPALSEGWVTFGSLNRIAKVSDETYRAWAKILLATPGSRMLLKAPELSDPGLRDSVAQRFAQAGVSDERLILLGRTPWFEHVQTCSQIDIMLDTFPHGGGVTAMESLAMGVPVVTLRWPTVAGRLSASVMTTMGLPDWIAEGEDEYVQLAVSKAQDMDALAQLRKVLRTIFMASVLGDTRAYVHAVEQEYRALWQRWCAKQDKNQEQAMTVVAQAVPTQAELERLVALFSIGHYGELESQSRQILGRYPESGFAWKALGLSLQRQGKEAMTALQRAAELLPGEPEIYNNLGTALQEVGRLDEAIESFRKALQLNPDYVEAHFNLGRALQESGTLDEAIESYRQALSLKPDYVEAHYGLGGVLQDAELFDEAAASYQRAIEIKQDFADAYNNLGCVLCRLGKLEEARSSFNNALRLRPDFAEAQYNMANMYRDSGQHERAISSFRRALEIRPDYAEAHSNLIFTLDLSDQADMAMLFHERKEWNSIHAEPLWQESKHANAPAMDRRLRVGYISGDFCNHSAPRVFGAMLTHYDREQFDVYAYSNYKGRKDEWSELFQKSVTAWYDISRLSDEKVAEKVRADGIDILVDLSGHTGDGRLLVFARKPAPVQITAWGYATGTGMRAMDAFLTDPIMVPPQDWQYFSEEIRYLPSAVSLFSLSPYPAVNELPSLATGEITFGSFNRIVKITERTYRAWAKVLLAVPQSRLLLKTSELNDQSMAEMVIKHFAELGVAAERIILRGKTSWQEHMQAYNLVDIALDPFPHGGGVTAMEGLAMGVPVVALRWPTVAGRLSASVMTTLGLPDWIAESEEEYVALAIKKVRDIGGLANLRRALRVMFMASVIGDADAYVRAVEREYRNLWRQWCERQTGCAAIQQPQEASMQKTVALRKMQEARLPKNGRQKAAVTHAEATQLAVLFNSGNYLGMEQLASMLVDREPDSGVAWKAYGTSLLHQGKDGVLALQRAIRLLPHDAETHNNLSRALLLAGKFKDAAIHARQALKINPAFAEAHNNLGNALWRLKEYKAAAESYRRATKIKPNFAEAHNNLGNVLKVLKQPEKAIASYRRALEINPVYFEASNNLGIILEGMGRTQEAVEYCRRCLEINPGYAEGYFNLGNGLWSLRKFDEAATNYRHAILIKPDYAEAYVNLGNIYKEKELLNEAIEHYHHALGIKPDIVEAHSNLARVLQKKGLAEEALVECYRALEIDPDHVDGHICLGIIQKELAQHEAAVASFRRALEIKPDYGAARSNLIFCLDLSPNSDMAELFRERRKWDKIHAEPLWREPHHLNVPDPARQLRVGYVSGDFREHSAARVFGGLLVQYNREQFEVYAYSNHAERADKYTEKFRHNVTEWRDIFEKTDEEVVEQIRADKIDILVDLSGHTAGNRLLVFARKPAPVQITAWGYATGTGMKAMDAFLTDPIMVPPQDKKYFSEEVRYLPSAVSSFTLDSYPDIYGLPAQTGGAITFGSFNRLVKVTAETYRAWGEILSAIPESRLLLKTAELDDPSVRDMVANHFASAGVDVSRLELQGKTPWFEHMQAFNQVDIALDPFPHGGGVTAMEGLAMGVPVVTLRWPTVAGRLSASVMTTLGLPDWIAESEEEYVELAVKKAQDIEALAQLRRVLRVMFMASMIGNTGAYVRAVEQEYRKLWQEWCARQQGIVKG